MKIIFALMIFLSLVSIHTVSAQSQIAYFPPDETKDAWEKTVTFLDEHLK